MSTLLLFFAQIETLIAEATVQETVLQEERTARALTDHRVEVLREELGAARAEILVLREQVCIPF